MSNTTGWIGVDLDGTLAEYHGWKGLDHIGEPIPAMVARVREWLREGRTVKIMTARVSRDAGTSVSLAKGYITSWCYTYLGQALEVVCEKDFSMLELWDDRAVQVILNTGLRADGKDDE